ncbi:MAG: FtsH protease activity modulator HflK [Azoarcus sp.]|nr:FtsH protease activity modulator HflK [Azoarcus sp.]
MSINDPHWGNRDGNKERGGKRGDDQGPPDLEEIWQDLNRRLSDMFGRRRGGNGNKGGNSGTGGPGLSPRQLGGMLGVLIFLVLLAWLITGIYMVDTNERGIVLRLGRFTEVTDPGLHWRLPRPFETHEIVDLTGLRTVPVGGRGNSRALMLTDDLNIVNVQFAVQYVLDGVNPENHIFENRDPNEEFVRQIAETAMRGIVGRSKMDFVLYEGREQIADAAQKLIQEILDRYKAGIQVSRVTMEEVQPPEQVQAAFDDATKATQDWERQKNEGEAYANKVIPLAQGTASRLLSDAQAYRAKAIASAEGDTSRFRQVLAEFKRAPQVTRERMYIETVQHVYSRASKVMIDDKGGNNLFLLPLDKLVQQTGARAAAVSAAMADPSSMPPEPSASEPLLQINPRDRDLMRDRERGER